jgi:hypothetical protein
MKNVSYNLRADPHDRRTRMLGRVGEGLGTQVKSK